MAPYLVELLITYWVKTSTNNPIEWLFILLSILWISTINNISFLNLINVTNSTCKESTSLLNTFFLNTQNYAQSNYEHLALQNNQNQSIINLKMILRLWCMLHIYKHLKLLKTILSKSSNITIFYTSMIILIILSFSVTVLYTILPKNEFSFDTIVMYFLVSDLKFITTLILHAMTSVNRTDLTNKITAALIKITPDRFILSALDIFAIGLGIFSNSILLKNLAFTSATAIILNLLFFLIFSPILLSLLLVHPTPKTEDKQNERYFLLMPMANWYESKSRNYLIEYSNEEDIVSKNRFILKMSLKAQVFGFFNVISLNFTQRFIIKHILNSLPNILKEVILSLFSVNCCWFYVILTGCLLYHYLFFNFENDTKVKIGNSVNRTTKLDNNTIIQNNLQNSNQNTNLLPDTISSSEEESIIRPLSIINTIYKDSGPSLLTDNEILLLISEKIILPHQLEKILQNPLRAIQIRRIYKNVDHYKNLPFKHYSDYNIVTKANCENVIGYIPVPLGLAGPLKINQNVINLPMATTEGALIASTCRGCKAITLSDGITSICYRNGMTRAPVVRLKSLEAAHNFYIYIENSFDDLKNIFEETTRYGKLNRIENILQGRNVYMRFIATTGDAMGMNMISKGCENVLKHLKTDNLFPELQVISISSNFCTDKKPSAVNFIQGRGKSIVSDCVIKKSIITTVLKTDAKSLAFLNKEKNLKGSALAGSIGGFNAHAANIVSAAFIACGQDPAQVVEGSLCMLDMEETSNNDLYVSCTMPCIEVGTIGGGTNLKAQKTSIEIVLDKFNESSKKHNSNSELLAITICSFVLAGELSLMAALCTGDLVKSHLRLNRIKVGDENIVNKDPMMHGKIL